MNDGRWQRRIEMGAFALGLATILAVVVGLLWLERPGQPDVPHLTAEVIDVKQEDGHTHVEFHVHNRGTAAAEHVIVRIGFPDGPPPLDQTIAYLPVGMSRRGIAVLYEVPGDARPTARIMGYLLP